MFLLVFVNVVVLVAVLVAVVVAVAVAVGMILDVNVHMSPHHHHDHERLDAYDVAVQLDAAVVALARRAGRGWLCDQATQASANVVHGLEGRPLWTRSRAPRI